MKVRVVFANGLESFRDITFHMAKDASGNTLYPEAFVTGRPNKPENVKVYIDEKLMPYLLADGKMVVYREKKPKP